MKLAWLCGGVFFAFHTFANEANSEMSLLNNRFRIDDSISQAAFVIERESPEQTIILVQPDGEKLYVNDHPETVFWHQEPTKDVITILDPQAGPWQAISNGFAANKIRVLSDLNLHVDIFPQRLYQAEIIKFTATILQGQQGVTQPDFLDSVALEVAFTQQSESESPQDESLSEKLAELAKQTKQLAQERIDEKPNAPLASQNNQPQNAEKAALPWILGRFIDDGTGLDERAWDGVFTIELPIDVSPGKYSATISAANDVFFRSVEQEVWVYPTPISVDFEQTAGSKPHGRLAVSADGASVVLDSLLVHAEFTAPTGAQSVYEQVNSDGYDDVSLDINIAEAFGENSWLARVYATDLLTERPLMFEFKDNRFVVVDTSIAEKEKQDKAKREAQWQQQEDEQRAIIQREEDKKTALVAIIGGNFLVFLIAIGAGFTFLAQKKRKQQRQQIETKAAQLAADSKQTQQSQPQSNENNEPQTNDCDVSTSEDDKPAAEDAKTSANKNNDV